MLIVLIDEIIQFDVQWILRVVGIVGTVAFILHTNLLEGYTVDSDRIGFDIVFRSGHLLIHQRIPIGLTEEYFNGLNSALIVKSAVL